jgi:hypothetical protein
MAAASATNAGAARRTSTERTVAQAKLIAACPDGKDDECGIATSG